MIENGQSAQIAIDLGWLITVVFVPFLWWLFKRIDAVKDEAHQEIDALNNKLSDYKLEAERQFASVGHLQEVERRLTDGIEGLREDLKEFRKDIRDYTKAMNKMQLRRSTDAAE